MYIWLTVHTFAFDDWKLEVLWSFIDALITTVDGQSCLSSFWSHELIGGWICLLWIPFDSMSIVGLISVITYPLEAFQVVDLCLLFSPFQWPFSPFEGLWFLTILMNLFSRSLYSKMFVGSKTIISRIFKSIYFRLIGFWELSLFNYPLTLILSFPILNLMSWHGTQGFPSLAVSWTYVSNFNSIRWDNPKLLVHQCIVPNLGINGGEGKWLRMFPNVLIQLFSDSWVSLRLPSCI